MFVLYCVSRAEYERCEKLGDFESADVEFIDFCITDRLQCAVGAFYTNLLDVLNKSVDHNFCGSFDFALGPTELRRAIKQLHNNTYTVLLDGETIVCIV